jgi:agmatine deiminase
VESELMATTPAAAGYAMPAEWAAREMTLMAWPVRPEAWLDGLAEARMGYAEAARAIAGFEKVAMVVRPQEAAAARRALPAEVELWEYPHDDSWLRDNGPTFVLDAAGKRAGVNWKFNAWGEKYRPYDSDDALAPLLLERMGVPRFDADFVLEGGSVHVDGEGTLLTTAECLLAPNRNPGLSKADLEARLAAYLGVSAFIWLDRGLAGDETDGHVDNLACFVRPGVVAVQVSSDPADPNYATSRDSLARLASVRDARGRKLQVVPIEQPPAAFCSGERLTLSYLNYYPVSGGLVVPVFGASGDPAARRADDAALGILAELYPGRRIAAVDGLKIIKGGGNVHCITQQVPAAGRPS